MILNDEYYINCTIIRKLKSILISIFPITLGTYKSNKVNLLKNKK